jgi:glutamine synthetase
MTKALEHPKGKVKIAITDLDGVLRGKYIHQNKFKSAAESNFGFCNVVFGWDLNDVCYDNVEHTGWHTGYPDDAAKIDLNTYREIPWDDNIPFFLADFDNGVCPRTLLKQIIKRADGLNFKSIFAQEFEWFNFKETPENLHEKNYVSPKPLTPGMFGYSLLRASRNNAFFNDLFDLLAKFSIPLEALHTETGPGVYEAAILYADILEAADRAALFKHAVKEIGMKYEIMPSFMAKWNEHLPGCGGHIHQSLWEGEKNIFFDQEDPLFMSKTMKSYLAGQLLCLPHILPMYAPNINSYKRLVEGAWAPTTLTWGKDNRTTAIRAIPGDEKSTRIEFRVAGSDVNPYLAMSACLASGLYGIQHNLQLETPMTVGNGYRNLQNGVLPRTLFEATLLMEKSEIAQVLFGDKFVKHFTQTRHWEWNQSLKPVTDWEIKRYFEII